MFGKKKVPNPDIEKLQQIFGDVIVEVIRGHSSTWVHLDLEQFIGIAKNSHTIIFRQDGSPGYPFMYFIIGPGGVMYFTEVAKKVKT